MRILHTSDWHLGRTLHGVDLREAQTQVVSEIEKTVITESVDCVIIAGDIFDRAVPPVESVTLFNDSIARIAEHATVVVTAGNHDSAIRLGHGSKLLRSGIHIVTELGSVGQGVEVQTHDGLQTMIFYPLPYLDPDHARYALRSREDSEPLQRSHQAVMAAAIDLVKADLRDRNRTESDAVVIAHAFVTGGMASESERDISVGGIDNVRSDLFEGFAYTALGHLHGPQTVGSRPSVAAESSIAYSGSPLRYSFSEARQRKGLLLVDIDSNGSSSRVFVPLTQPREMSELRGELNEILCGENIASHAGDWLRITVTDQARPTELNQRIRDAYPYVLSVVHEPVGGTQSFGASQTVVDLTDPVEISRRFVADVTAAETTDRDLAVLRAAYEAARSGGDA